MYVVIYATKSKNVPLDRRAQRTFRPDCAFAQSGLNVNWAHFRLPRMQGFLMLTKTTIISRLGVFVGRTCQMEHLTPCDSYVSAQPRWLSWIHVRLVIRRLRFRSLLGRQHSFKVIKSLPLIQEGQLSVSGEIMCAILVNRLQD